MSKRFWIPVILYAIGYWIIMSQVPADNGSHSINQWLIVMFGSWFFIFGAMIKNYFDEY